MAVNELSPTRNSFNLLHKEIYFNVLTNSNAEADFGFADYILTDLSVFGISNLFVSAFLMADKWTFEKY